MANPTKNALHVDGLLTNVSIGYKNATYIADELCPTVPVKKQSDIVPKYDQSYWFRNSAQLRAPGTASARGGFKVNTSDTYYCHRYSFGFEIPDETRDNQDDPFSMDRDGAEFATDRIQMRREVAFATDHFTTSVWGTDKTGATDFTKWSDYGSSTPLVDITEYADVIEASIARMPNKLAMGKQVWLQLKWHPDAIDTIKYTQKGMLSLDLFASLVELEKVLVGRAIYTTDPEGTAEASVSYTRVWGKNFLLMYAPDRPSLFNPAAAYCFTWTRVPNSIQYVRRLRDDEREIDVIEANTYFDQKVTASGAGLFGSAAVA